jgi:hypothetical protein
MLDGQGTFSCFSRAGVDQVTHKAHGTAVLLLALAASAALVTGCGGSDGKKDAPKPVVETTLNGWTASKLGSVLLITGDVPGYKARTAPPAHPPTASRSVSDQCRDFTDASLQIASGLGSAPVADTALTGTGTAQKDYGATVFVRAYASPDAAAQAVTAFHDGMAKCGRGVVALPDPGLGDKSAGYVAGSMEPGGFGGMAVQVGALTVGVQVVHQGASKPDAEVLKQQLTAIAQKQVEKLRAAQPSSAA